jgi:predicted MFS family arabinose efflux permease
VNGPPPRLRVLRVRAFRWFFAGQAVSSFGDFLMAPALALAVLDLTGSAGDIGLVLAARSVPIVVFMLLGGVLADRIPRDRLMVGADLARLAGQGGTALLLLAGDARIWPLMCLQALNGTASAMFTPAVSRLIQETTPADLRQAANALRAMSQSATMIAGPAVSTLLILTVGPSWAVMADAATFGVSAACLARLRPREAGGPPNARHLVRDLRDGWRELTARTWTWSLIVAASVSNMLATTFAVLGPVVSVRYVSGGAGAWGVVMTAYGAGAVTGGVVALNVRPSRPLRFAVLGGALFALPSLVMSQASVVAPIAAGAFLGGAGLMLFDPLWETVLQREIPAAALSKVSAYEWFGSYLGQPIGLALAGPMAAHLGVRGVLLAAGLANLAVSLAPLAVRDVRDYATAPNTTEG